MRVLFTPIGTRGDVQRLLPPALELHRRGHDVVLGGPANFRGWVEGTGIAFVPIMDSVADIPAGPEAIEGILFAARDQGERILTATTEAAKGATLVVASGPHPAAISAAELVGARYVYVAPSPTYLRSSAHPPLGWGGGWRLPIMNRVHWRLQETAYQVIFGRAANRARKTRGLRPIRSLLYTQYCGGEILFAFDPELEPIAPDLAGKGVLTGPLEYADARELPKEVVDFLDAGAPPLYLGFGSMADLSPTTMLELAAAIATRCRIRVIVFPEAALGEGHKTAFSTPSPGVATVGSVDHAKLFPRVRAVVHHGGSGTTYVAAIAGVPQAIVPHHGDQFWFGRRVAAVGLGPEPLRLKDLTPDRLVRLVDALVGDPAYGVRARAYRERVAQHGGVRAAADALERMGAP